MVVMVEQVAMAAHQEVSPTVLQLPAVRARPAVSAELFQSEDLLEEMVSQLFLRRSLVHTRRRVSLRSVVMAEMEAREDLAVTDHQEQTTLVVRVVRAVPEVLRQQVLVLQYRSVVWSVKMSSEQLLQVTLKRVLRAQPVVMAERQLSVEQVVLELVLQYMVLVAQVQQEVPEVRSMLADLWDIPPVSLKLVHIQRHHLFLLVGPEQMDLLVFLLQQILVRQEVCRVVVVRRELFMQEDLRGIQRQMLFLLMPAMTLVREEAISR
jgi:hypothetical protein